MSTVQIFRVPAFSAADFTESGHVSGLQKPKQFLLDFLGVLQSLIPTSL